MTTRHMVSYAGSIRFIGFWLRMVGSGTVAIVASMDPIGAAMGVDWILSLTV